MLSRVLATRKGVRLVDMCEKARVERVERTEDHKIDELMDKDDNRIDEIQGCVYVLKGNRCLGI